MKNIKVYDKQNKLISDENKYENENDFINYIVSSNYFGKPERWVIAKELMENGDTKKSEHWMWHSEYYEESDIIKTEKRIRKYIANEINDLGHTIEVEKERIETWVLLKADYTIEIIDLDKDYNYLLNECHTKRKKEYPAIEDYSDGIVKNDEIQKQKYIDKCLQVKLKYPLPIRENL
jgi:hypothetical protein